MLKPYRVNETGLLAIKGFLAKSHKLGDNFTRENLLAWACDAEEQLSYGNPACIEIPSVVSSTNHDECFFLPDDGLDWAEVWVAWEDGQRSDAVEFLVPVGKAVDVGALGADALGVDLSPFVNVKKA